ncbi:hypothetical protein [Actinoplanes flavus]|uniref:XRE family transcriptional regulator n=1 Tax=Actinoplanes flavus TaxID=2820290 RepID=A0ABS3UG05_9ACTN|nr:hypothetical protein [Actinoplanes flavus]MBO3736698.1 hypothetical protein [Actinoplanes flavus]
MSAFEDQGPSSDGADEPAEEFGDDELRALRELLGIQPLSPRLRRRLTGLLDETCTDGQQDGSVVNPSSSPASGADVMAMDSRAAVVGRASLLAEDGDCRGAGELVAPLFAGIDPVLAAPDLVLADAVHIRLGSRATYADAAATCVAWAGYSRAANALLRGRGHPRTVEAARLAAQVAESWAFVDCGWWPRAADAYQAAIDANVWCGDADAADVARVRQAVSLHALGRCGDAIRLAGRVWRGWRDREGHDPWLGQDIVSPYLMMLRRCGRYREAELVEVEALAVLPGRYRLMVGRLIDADDLRIGRYHDRICRRHLTWDTL